jgi:uncharacterized membrane protein
MAENPSQKDLLNSIGDIAKNLGGQPETARPYTFGIATVLLLALIIGPMKISGCPIQECIEVGRYVLGFGLIVTVFTMLYDLARLRVARVEQQVQRSLYNDVLSSVEKAHGS